MSIALLNVNGIDHEPFSFGLGLGNGIMTGQDCLNDRLKKLFDKELTEILGEVQKPDFLDDGDDVKNQIDALFEETGKLKLKAIDINPKLPGADRKAKTKLFSGLVKNNLSIWETPNMTKIQELILTHKSNLQKKETINNIMKEFFTYFFNLEIETQEVDPQTGEPVFKKHKFESILEEKYWKKDDKGEYKKDAKELDKNIFFVNDTDAYDMEKIKEYYNGGLYAYTYLCLKEILNTDEKTIEKLFLKDTENILQTKKKVIKDLANNHLIVCINEFHDTLIDDEILNYNIIKSDKAGDKKYSVILSKQTDLLKEPKDPKKQELVEKNEMGGEIVHCTATIDGVSYTIICHHAGSYSMKHKKSFNTTLDNINKAYENLIYCVDSNSPYTLKSDIEDHNLKLVSPILINELSDDKKPEKTPIQVSSLTNYTCYKVRTFLQPQLDKAGLPDKTSKDFIICSKNINNIKHTGIMMNTAEGIKEKNSDKIPTIEHPLDHFIVVATLGSAPDAASGSASDAAPKRAKHWDIAKRNLSMLSKMGKMGKMAAARAKNQSKHITDPLKKIKNALSETENPAKSWSIGNRDFTWPPNATSKIGGGRRTQKRRIKKRLSSKRKNIRSKRNKKVKSQRKNKKRNLRKQRKLKSKKRRKY